MANHKDAIKRIRQTEKRRLHNRYYAKNMRNEIKKFRALTSKSEAEGQLSKLYSIIDKVAKRGIIHWKFYSYMLVPLLLCGRGFFA